MEEEGLRKKGEPGGHPVALFEEFGNHIPSQKLQETQNL